MSFSTITDISTEENLGVEISCGEVRVQAVCIPPREQGWSLDPLFGNDEKASASLARDIACELDRFGAVRAYATAAHLFSGLVVPPCRLDRVIGLDKRIPLFFNMQVPAEGVPLEPREALIMATGGCATVIALGEGRCIGAHGGRNSLIDRARVLRKAGGRVHMSVIDDMARMSRAWGLQNARTVLRTLFYLDPAVFSHPVDNSEQGKFHRGIATYANDLQELFAWYENGKVHLDIGRLTNKQAKKAGFGEYSAGYVLPVDGPFAYTRHSDKAMRAKRNLVIVYRKT